MIIADLCVIIDRKENINRGIYCFFSRDKMLKMKKDTAKHWRNSKKIRFVWRKIIENRANVLNVVSLRRSRCKVEKYITVIEAVIAQKFNPSQCLHIDIYAKKPISYSEVLVVNKRSLRGFMFSYIGT